MGISIFVRDWVHRHFGSLDHNRLANFISDAWMDLDREIHSSGAHALLKPWARSAYTLLLRAEDQLSRWEIEGGWAAALSVQRAILSNPDNPDRIKRAAIVLRRETAKITGWRAKAIDDLMAESEGETAPANPQNLMRVIDAITLRDDFSQNTWFKIHLRLAPFVQSVRDTLDDDSALLDSFVVARPAELPWGRKPGQHGHFVRSAGSGGERCPEPRRTRYL